MFEIHANNEQSSAGEMFVLMLGDFPKMSTSPFFKSVRALCNCKDGQMHMDINLG